MDYGMVWLKDKIDLGVLADLRSQGLTIREIAIRLQIGKSKVEYWLHRIASP
jgi:transposase